MPPHVIALEIGTSRAIALVGELREDMHIMITGMGEAPSQGVRKGDVVDIEAAAAAARTALQGAEESAKITIREVFLAVSGSHIGTLVNRGQTPVAGADNEIGPADIAQVRRVARAVNLPPDRDILHTVSRQFRIDGRRSVTQPEGLRGVTLDLDVLIVHGLRNEMQNLAAAAEEASVAVVDMAFSGLCSAVAVLSAEQKRSGAVVIDLGAGVTDYVAYVDGAIAAAGAVGVGGDHIANDIALAFHIPLRQAERCKGAHGTVRPAEPPAGEHVAIAADVGFAGRTLPWRSLRAVVHARADETLRLVRRRLDEAGVPAALGGGVVLVGGGARLAGIAELGGEVFGMPCVIGRPRGASGLATATEGPQYATAVGLVQYGFRHVGARGGGHSLRDWLKGVLKR